MNDDESVFEWLEKALFTDRHGQEQPRTAEVLDDPTRFGLLELVSAKIAQEWFGKAFPQMCDDGFGNSGCDKDSMRKMLAAYAVIDPDDLPHAKVTDAQVFDVLEFSYEKMALPLQGGMA